MDPGVLLAVEERSGHGEVAHLGHAVVVDAAGAPAWSLGDPEAPCYWRSAAKPLQAVPLARVAGRFGLGGAAIAVACASHSGEGRHVEAAAALLAAIGLGEEALLCGTHAPWHKQAVYTAESARALHSNCSGNHAGLLAACVANGWDTATYFAPEHPVQREVAALVRQASGFAPHVGVDGCGLPTFRTPLVGLARAFQWLHAREPPVLDAMGAFPDLVGGTGEFDVELLRATGGRVVGKYGALGVYAAVERGTGRALAVRITTGNEMVCDAVAGRLMVRQGWLDAVEAKAIAPHVELPVVNHRGAQVGQTRFLLG